MLLSKMILFGKSILQDLSNHLSKVDSSRFSSSSKTSLSKLLSSPSKHKSIIQMSIKREIFVLRWLTQVTKSGPPQKDLPKSWRESYHCWSLQIWTLQLTTKQHKISKTTHGLTRPSRPPNNMPNDV